MSTVTIISGVGAYLEAGNLAFSIGAVHLSFTDVDVELAAAQIRAASGRNVVVDGFPTTVEEAVRLDVVLARSNLRVTRFISASLLDDHALVETHALRRMCPSSSCGAKYNLRQMRPRQADVCDVCGAVGLVKSHHDVDACVLADAVEQRRKSMLLREHYRAVADNFVEQDPLESLSEAILGMQSHLIQAKKQIAVAIADARRLEKLATDARQAVADSKEALQPAEIVAGHERLAARYEKQLIEQRSSVDTLKAALQELNRKTEEMKRRKNLLVAIEARAEAEHEILRLAWSASGVIDPIKQ
jgi:hypothetical protein